MHPNWSKWQPRRTRALEDGAAQIAEQGRRRVQAPERQAARAGQGGPIGDARGRAAPASGNISRPDGNTVIYQLDGLGPSGSIKGGEPSTRGAGRPPRGAGALALHVPLPAGRRGRDGAAAAAAAGPGRGRDGQAAAGDGRDRRPRRSSRRRADGEAAHRAIFFRPGDLKSAAAGPARRDGPGAGAERGRRSTQTEAEADRPARRARTCSRGRSEPRDDRASILRSLDRPDLRPVWRIARTSA